jgi:hypothetical protein
MKVPHWSVGAIGRCWGTHLIRNAERQTALRSVLWPPTPEFSEAGLSQRHAKGGPACGALGIDAAFGLTNLGQAVAQQRSDCAN